MPKDGSQQTGDRVHLPPVALPDAYVEGGLLVYTAAHHLERGHCCGSGCRHCPYEPKHRQGTTAVATMNTPAEAAFRP